MAKPQVKKNIWDLIRILTSIIFVHLDHRFVSQMNIPGSNCPFGPSNHSRRLFNGFLLFLKIFVLLFLGFPHSDNTGLNEEKNKNVVFEIFLQNNFKKALPLGLIASFPGTAGRWWWSRNWSSCHQERGAVYAVGSASHRRKTLPPFYPRKSKW